MLSLALQLPAEMPELSAQVSFFLDMSLKGGLVLLLAAILSWQLQRLSAAARHLVWSVALASVLLLPIFSLSLPHWQLPISSPWAAGVLLTAKEKPAQLDQKRIPLGVATASTDGLALQESAVPAELKTAQRSIAAIEPAGTSEWSWARLLLAIWAAGAMLVIGRVVLGMVRLGSLTRRAVRIADSDWLSLARESAAHLGLQRNVRLYQSEQVELPLTWGWWRSVVLLPAESQQWSTECRRIVLLHELTHIKRWDCLLQSIAQLACAVYWFNPLVWWGARQLRVEREMACDDQVLAVGTKASDYASTLVEVASLLRLERYPSPVAVGMACSHLESRVRSILDPQLSRKGVNRRRIVAVSLAACALLAPLAMLQAKGNAAASQASAPKSDDVLVASHLLTPVFGTGLQKQGANASAGKVTDEVAPEMEDALDAQDKAQSAGQTVGQGSGKSSELTVEQLIEMKAVGVTPEFIEAMRKAGYEQLSVRELVELRAVGVTDGFLKEVAGWSQKTLTARELVEIRTSGLTNDYINAMGRAGYGGIPLQRLIEMRHLGVTPEYAAQMREQGFDNLTPEKLVSLRALGVSAEFAKEAQNWGFGKFNAEQLIEIKALGITPEYARQMKALGFDALSLNNLVELKSLGVNETYVKEMRSLGFDKLSPEQLIEMKALGVTPEYVKKMRAAGLKNVSVNQLIELKATGMDKILTKENR